MVIIFVFCLLKPFSFFLLMQLFQQRTKIIDEYHILHYASNVFLLFRLHQEYGEYRYLSADRLHFGERENLAGQT